ncbi:hypothetical protein ASPCAL14581 [Aspergillus calidoustus]|uniref:Uncharacterized protein n=1 Tax=Aspergillus calidoustus TaxID=454130 RepID=A0A0U5GJD2_ASPCI|nr:hypothetical protein ASPCAL14581 [Aspergillus calidoustus]
MDRPYARSEADYERYVKVFMQDPTRGIDDYWLRKLSAPGSEYVYGNLSLDIYAVSSTLERRANLKPEKTQEVLRTLLISDASQALYDIWKEHVVSTHQHLTIAKIKAYINEGAEWTRGGLVDLSRVCAMDAFNALLGSTNPIQCICRSSRRMRKTAQVREALRQLKDTETAIDVDGIDDIGDVD